MSNIDSPQYLSSKDIGVLKKTLVSFAIDTSKDKRIGQPYFQNNEQWEFFYLYFKKHAEEDIKKICSNIISNHKEIKKTIFFDAIYDIFQRNVFYAIFRGEFTAVALKTEKFDDGSMAIDLAPRKVGLDTFIKYSDDLAIPIVEHINQQIANKISFYKNHRVITWVPVTNLRIDKDVCFEFANVSFISKECPALTENFVKWVKMDKFRDGERTMLRDSGNFAIIKFEGCSAPKAIFDLSRPYFNKVFGVLRLLLDWAEVEGELIGTKQSLETEYTVIYSESSHDNSTMTAVMPEINSDFFIARNEYWIRCPIISSKSIEQISNSPNLKATNALLERAYNSKSTSLDSKIFDSLFWYSESLKHFTTPHKLVGFVTALETILTSNKLTEGFYDKSISEMFSERGAIVLCDSYEDRLEMKRKLKGIYRIRSILVHGSGTGSISDSEITDAHHLATGILLGVIDLANKENISSVEELNDYFQKVLLS